MAKVLHTCTDCVPIDASIIDTYVALIETEKRTRAAEEGRVTAENERVAAEEERTRVFTADHGTATDDHTTAADDHTTAAADHIMAHDDHVLAVADHDTAGEDHTASSTAAARANAAAAAAEHMTDIRQGPPGVTPDISVGTVTTGAAGSQAEVTITGTPEEPVLNMTIPRGSDGETGATPNFSIGTVATGAAGAPAAASITGTAVAPVLNLTIPQGIQGNTGSSVDFPYELVNNRTTNDPTKGAAASALYALGQEHDQLEQKAVKEIPSIAPVEIVDAQGNIAMTLSDGHIATKKFDSRGFFDPGNRSLKQTAATFGSGDTITIDHVPNVRNKYVLSFMAEISAIGTLKVQYGDTNIYARGIVTINGTTVIVAKHGSGSGTDEYTHGLTFSQYIEVVVRPTIPNHAKLSILTTGGRFDQVIEWAGSSDDIVVSSTDGGSFTNAEVTMSYYGFGSRLWIYGASWTDMFPDLMTELGMPNYLLNGWSGKTTGEGVMSFIEDIQRGWGKPDYLLFILGANNPESGQGTITGWQNAYELLIETCNQYNIQLIGCTIPDTAAGGPHTYKNNYIKTCGIRYVDMAAAMGCSEPNSTGYAGVMMNDGKHPTTPVGCMKFSLALLEQINNIITEMAYV